MMTKISDIIDEPLTRSDDSTGNRASSEKSLHAAINLLLLLVILSAGCDVSGKAKPAAEKEVEQFHAMLNDGKYREIYQEAGPQLKEVTSEWEMVDLLQSVEKELGTVQSTKTTQWRTDSFLTYTQVVLVKETEFSRGKAVETFTYAYTNHTASLIGYKVDYQNTEGIE